MVIDVLELFIRNQPPTKAARPLALWSVDYEEHLDDAGTQGREHIGEQ